MASFYEFPPTFLKVMKQLRGALFATKYLEICGTHFNDFRMMKTRVLHGAS